MGRRRKEKARKRVSREAGGSVEREGEGRAKMKRTSIFFVA